MVKIKFVNDDEKPTGKKEKKIEFKNLKWYLKMAFALSCFQFTVLFSYTLYIVFSVWRNLNG